MKKLLLLLTTILLLSSCEYIYIGSNGISSENNSSDIQSEISSEEISSNEEGSSFSSVSSESVSSNISSENTSLESSEISSSPSFSESISSEESLEPEPDYNIIPSNFYTFEGKDIIKIFEEGNKLPLKEYTNYIILDREGRIYYTVANSGCGYGIEKYYSHPLYHQDVLNSINKVDNSITIPQDFTAYSISFDAYGKWANSLSNGVIPTDYFDLHGYGIHTYKWNSLNNAYLGLENGIKIDTSIKVESITASVISKYLYVGETAQINVTISPENASDKTLTYSTNNSYIASVSSKGLVTANNPGNATITISSSNGITNTIDFSVSKKEEVVIETPLPSIGNRIFYSPSGCPDGNDYFYSADAKPSSTTITNGVVYTKYNYSSINGYSLNVYTITIDLDEVTLELGTPSDSYFPTTTSVLKNQANAYESSSGRKVYAAINGDFFGAGAKGMPNGFSVKDGVVVSNCSPWYEDLVNGMWAFSVSYNNIASIDESASSWSSYEYVDNYIELYNSQANRLKSVKIDAINNNIVYDPNYGSSRTRNNEVITYSGLSVSNKNVVYINKTETYDNGNGNINFPFDGRISKISKNFSGEINLSNNEVALLVDSSFLSSAKIDLRVRVGRTISSSSAFDNVKTLIGGRHLLVSNYKELSNIKSETTNGANSRRARTAIGLMSDGKVMLFACNDSSGLTLQQVADFMAYYGCHTAMNLDGGGSTGLYVRQNDSLSLKAGANSRGLTNSLLVVEK